MPEKISGPEKAGMKMSDIYMYILVMAVVTYLVRVLPLTVFKKEITNKYVTSFLYYVPYACLAAMTFPAIVTATETPVSGIAALIAAFVSSFKGRSLLESALWACAAVFVVERVIAFI